MTRVDDTSGHFLGLLLTSESGDDLEGEVEGIASGLSRDEVSALDDGSFGDLSTLQVLLKARVGDSFLPLEEVSTSEDGGCSTDSTEELAVLVSFADELVQAL